MAGPFDFFSPGEWNIDPRVAPAATQFGLNLATSGGWGQSPFEGVIRAIGGAGENIGRQDELARKEQEAASKADLREAQAGAAGALADARMMRAGTEQDKLEILREGQRLKQQDYEMKAQRAEREYLLKRDALDLRKGMATSADELKRLNIESQILDRQHRQTQSELRTGFLERRGDIQEQRERGLGERNLLGIKAGASRQYNELLEAVKKRNANILTTKPEPVPTFEEWIRGNRFYRGLYFPEEYDRQGNPISGREAPAPNAAPARVAPAGAPAPAPAAPAPPSTGQQIPQGAIDALKKNPKLAEDFDAKYGVGEAARVLGVLSR